MCIKYYTYLNINLYFIYIKNTEYIYVLNSMSCVCLLNLNNF